jgi:exodeoxyribonuclease-5
VHVIALGDPGQLPPIGEDNGVLKTPHVFLDEIMRQAQESEIIRLTMDIREGKPLKLFKGNEVQIIDRKDLVNGMYLWADQIIVGKNATRHNINYEMRKMIHGVEDNLPVDGDKVVCLRNDWNMANNNGDVLVNGLIGYLRNPVIDNHVPYISKCVTSDFLLEEHKDTTEFSHYVFPRLQMDYNLFNNHEFTINTNNFRKVPKLFHPKQFDYGYCITCHKSQGSEYNKVLVFEEYLAGGEHERWLYTAATRAKEKLVIVRNY